MNMNNNNDRKGRTKDVKGVFFPTPATQFEMPDWYGEMLVSIKELVANGRRQVMFTANVQMSMMYYRIGQIILQRQNDEGWGSKVVDRLSADLKNAFPEMHGFSPRNLKYMRRFCEIWPDEEIVQRCVAQLPWRHNICLMEKVNSQHRFHSPYTNYREYQRKNFNAYLKKAARRKKVSTRLPYQVCQYPA